MRPEPEKEQHICSSCKATKDEHWTFTHKDDWQCGQCAGTAPDWSEACCVCGASPIVPRTGMCGPCTFGEAETAGGNW